MVRKNVVDGINGLSNNKDFDEKNNPNSKNFASKMAWPCENCGQVNGYNISRYPFSLYTGNTDYRKMYPIFYYHFTVIRITGV